MYHKSVKRNMGLIAFILVLASLTIGYSKLQSNTNSEGIGVIEAYAGPVLATTYRGDARAFKNDIYRKYKNNNFI